MSRYMIKKHKTYSCTLVILHKTYIFNVGYFEEKNIVNMNRPIILINFAAKKANNAIPTTDKAIGRVAKDFIGLNFEPIIPLKKTVTGAAVKAKI